MDTLFTMKMLSRYAQIWKQIQEGALLSDDEDIVAGVMKEHPEFDVFWPDGETALRPQEIDGFVVNPMIHAGLHVVGEKQILEHNPEEVEIALQALVARGITRHEAMHQIIGIWGDLYFQSIRGGSSLFEWEYIELINNFSRAA